MSPSYVTLYDRAVLEHGWINDPAQRAAAEALDALAARLHNQSARPSGPLSRFLKRFTRPKIHPATRGLYLWGPVGRGKTFLMDLFCAHSPVSVQRLHFHHFMRSVHAQLRDRQAESNPLQKIAIQLAAQIQVLCFDELQVTDIADAMILGTLFEALIQSGVTLIFTSNTPPSGLYPNGLQRVRFLPTVSLLEQHCQIVTIDGGTDYRLREMQREPLWLLNDANATPSQLADRFKALAGNASTRAGILEINGRSITVRAQSANCVWFDFAELCESARSTEDYIVIAERFSLVALSDIPILTAEQDDSARRFIALVDEFYERGVKLVASAQALPDELYQGSRLSFTFQRTASRLTEMQSTQYLARPHAFATGLPAPR